MFILRFLNNSVTVHLLASLVWIVNFGWSIVVIWLGKWPSGIQTSTLAPTWRGKKCTPKRVWYNWVLQNLMHCTKFAFHRIKKYIQLLRQFAAVQQGQLWTFRITASQLQILIPDVFTCLGRCAFSDCILYFLIVACILIEKFQRFPCGCICKKRFGSQWSIWQQMLVWPAGRCVNASL